MLVVKYLPVFASQHNIVSPHDPAYWEVLTDASSISSQSMLQALAQEPNEKLLLDTLHVSDTESERCPDPDAAPDASNFLVELLHHANTTEENKTPKAFTIGERGASWKMEEGVARTAAGSLQTELLQARHTMADRLTGGNSGSSSDSGVAYVCIEENLDAHGCAHSKSASGGDDSGILVSSSVGAMAVEELPAMGGDRGGLADVSSGDISQLQYSREGYFSDGESCRQQGRCSSSSNALKRHRSSSM